MIGEVLRADALALKPFGAATVSVTTPKSFSNLNSTVVPENCSVAGKSLARHACGRLAAINAARPKAADFMARLPSLESDFKLRLIADEATGAPVRMQTDQAMVAGLRRYFQECDLRSQPPGRCAVSAARPTGRSLRQRVAVRARASGPRRCGYSRSAAARPCRRGIPARGPSRKRSDRPRRDPPHRRTAPRDRVQSDQH